MNTKHYTNDRKRREAIIKNVIGEGKEVETFTVDRGHKNGPELHTITTTGIIIIRNARTKKIITKLIARPAQIKRYFKVITDTIQKIIDLAIMHTRLGYNTY